MIMGSVRLTASTAALCTAFTASLSLAQENASSGSGNEPLSEPGVIVVTAQKREQNLQDVPISISVVDGDVLQDQGAVSLADYAGNVPGC
ncbi:TonB-dependent receptor [Pacificimonas flava]|uniref:TonB-dependent receptor n=1 Tax=Pacificimonas flava TaxID=1234595 RepID=UPI00160F6D67|nr:TonB-dependent receptor [Pacificimonas flava]MBB5281695.1 outer membrane receptor protein involved in Fe transport [Pacificimonas flava]